MADETPSRVVAVVPGAFKPPHAGHVGLIGDYAGQADKVIIMVSPKSRDGITAEQSIAIWKIFLEELPYDNIEVMESPSPSPVGSAFDFVENKSDDPNLAQPGDEVLLGVSTKGGDDKRFCANVQKYARDGVIVRGDCAIKPKVNPETNIEYSASNLRDAMNKGGDVLRQYMPKEVHHRIEEIEGILEMKEKKEPITLENLFDMVKEVMDEEEGTVEEISSMAGGSVAGYSLPLGAKPRKTKKKKRKGRRIYIPD